MSTQIFATVTGAKQGVFKGESTQKGFENKIPCVGFNYGVTVPHDQATGQASGKRQHEPVSITGSGAQVRRSSSPPPIPTRC